MSSIAQSLKTDKPGAPVLLFAPLLCAGIERALNTMIYRDQALKTARLAVQGKVLRLVVREFVTPLVVVFSAQRLDVLTDWSDTVNATVSAKLGALRQLNRQLSLTGLIRSGDLDVQGDMQFVQQVVALMDLARGDLAHWLSFVAGDVAGQAVSDLLCVGVKRLKRGLRSGRQVWSQALTDEWQLAPGSLEVAGFANDNAALASDVDALARRLDKLEGQ